MPYNIELFEKTHPIRIYLEENILIRELLDKLVNLKPKNYQVFFNIFNNLCEVELHYVRKENQLFPFIEKYGWNTTSQYMWTFHDQIREQLKEIREVYEEQNYSILPSLLSDLSDNMNHMILLEESTLFKNAINDLSKDDWSSIAQGDAEIGFMIKTVEEYIHPKNDFKKRELKIEGDREHFEEGFLTPLQVNLIFKHLPLDITYVDENDKVVFYNNGEERIFPRSPGIIGREVKFCHPPKSVDQVLKILESFKNGTQDKAEFWINFRGDFIHIRFFAIRDERKNYKGVMEITQDVTDIKALEGEKRILDWQG